jgi:hypothetical protein
MSLGVPIYSYCVVKGGKRQRQSYKGVHNIDSADKLDMLFAFLSHPVVRKIAIDGRHFYSRDDRDIREIEWRGPTYYEEDVKRRPRLRALMKKLNDRGAIVIPSDDHVVEGYEDVGDFLKKVCESALAPISVSGVQGFIQPILRDLNRHQPDLHPRAIEKRIDKALVALTNGAVHVRGMLENSRARRKFG